MNNNNNNKKQQINNNKVRARDVLLPPDAILVQVECFNVEMKNEPAYQRKVD